MDSVERVGCRCQPPGGGGSAARCVFPFLLVNMHNLRGGSPEDDPSRLLSLINFKQTQRPDTAIHALNSRINAYFQPSVNKGRKALAGKAREESSSGALGTTL